jgi:hypothetical protein
MLLYDVTYYHGRSMDRECSWGYLKSLQCDSQFRGAIAICTNGEPHKLLLDSNGDWTEIKAAEKPMRRGAV